MGPVPDFSFAGGMNLSLDTAASTFGAGEVVIAPDGVRKVPVISVSSMTESTKRAFGGILQEANATISVRKGVAAEYGLEKGKSINVRGKDTRIMEIDPRLNDSDTLICGPVDARGGFRG